MGTIIIYMCGSGRNPMLSVLLRSLMLLIGLIAAAAIASAAGEDPAHAPAIRPVGVLLFSDVIIDPLTLADGAAVRASEVDPPLSTYSELNELNATEPSLFPETFDAVVIVSNETGKGPGTVVVELSMFARVGPLLLHSEVGVTDIERGIALSEWQREPLVQRMKKLELGKNSRYYSVSLKSLEWRKEVDRLVASGRWPFEVEFVARVNCSSCKTADLVKRVVSVVPAD